MKTYPPRRRFLMQMAVMATALPVLIEGIHPHAHAALPRLTPDNPQAKTLGYVEDAHETGNPTFKPGSACANCQFFTAATGACALFPSFSVASAGWCSAWAKKA